MKLLVSRKVDILEKRRAFTLIELLVVIAIIALLMAILMPALNKAKLQAKSVVCQSNVKQWALLWSMYTSDHDGYFHTGWYSGFNPKGSWPMALKPYYKNEEICFCPMASKLLADGARQVVCSPKTDPVLVRV